MLPLLSVQAATVFGAALTRFDTGFVFLVAFGVEIALSARTYWTGLGIRERFIGIGTE